eukprot:3271496-Prymnesium_polylepis.1
MGAAMARVSVRVRVAADRPAQLDKLGVAALARCEHVHLEEDARASEHHVGRAQPEHLGHEVAARRPGTGRQCTTGRAHCSRGGVERGPRKGAGFYVIPAVAHAPSLRVVPGRARKASVNTRPKSGAHTSTSTGGGVGLARLGRDLVHTRLEVGRAPPADGGRGVAPLGGVGAVAVELGGGEHGADGPHGARGARPEGRERVLVVELLEEHARGVARLRDARRLEDAARLELLERHRRVHGKGEAAVVGLDAADEMALRRVESGDELLHVVSELGGD